jgi:hypothetical protein
MELKSAVRSLIVVMVDVLIQHPLEVRSPANDQPVQAFATNTSHPALGKGVGVRFKKYVTVEAHRVLAAARHYV